MLSAEELAKDFLVAFPEYTEEYHEHMEDYGKLQGHVFWGDIFSYILISKVKENEDLSWIHKTFDFLERMASEGDKYVRNILQVTILARLGDDPLALHMAYTYMGKNTRESSDWIENHLGRAVK
ncbi:hypothetical protein IC620_07260 [Hazenella sp. IB182357]|uniref:DUF7674 domain-containing protein n=1 Tax=Polycladospora coralii TaxID=2771432 RepID=A0A926NEN5_9BACL|nr:hypothetical protein [Polycladospora coralii]MBD1372159.1 hypothetical protein [Polycladospora coralii]